MHKIITIVILILIVSCGAKEEEVTDKQYVVELLNSRQYHEASIILNDLVEKNPHEDTLKVMLASAYGGLAGIDLVDSFAMYTPAIFDNKKPEKSKKNSLLLIQEGDGDVNAKSSFEKDLVKFIDNLSMSFSIFFGKSEISKEKRKYLVEALLVLSYIDSTSSQYIASKSYSGLLNLVQFFNYMGDAFPTLDKEKGVSFLSLLCSFEPSIFFSNLSDSTKYLAKSAGDIKLVTEAAGKKISSKLAFIEERSRNIYSVYSENKHVFLASDFAFNSSKSLYCK